jgi:predicted ATP-grasp superfamily ATP-dependent carboligase
VQESETPYAIVVGLDNMTGLQTARILARHNIPVVAVAEDLGHPCCRTRVCEQILAADSGGDELIKLLEALGPELKQKAVLFPCTDANVFAISQHRERLKDWYHVILPLPETVEMLMDKLSFYSYAQENGLPVPRTLLLKDRTDAERAAEQLTFPCLMKPSMKSPVWQQQVKTKVLRVASAQELLGYYDRFSELTEALLAQEWVEGTDSNLYSCNCYFNTATEPLVTFVARKLRQWPPEAGTSCLGEEVRNDIVLQETIRLFQDVNYVGLGYVEMKRDEHTGKHYIIEPNIGRPTGRSAISEAGGVELVYTMYCDAVGWPLPANREQKYGDVKWIFLRRDIQAALYYWRKGELTFREWLQSIRGRKAYALFSWRDLGPFLRDITRTISRMKI